MAGDLRALRQALEIVQRQRQPLFDQAIHFDAPVAKAVDGHGLVAVGHHRGRAVGLKHG
jgi:hypothetical protein